VSRFVEKPNIHDARALIETGSLWNSGVAIGTARSIIGALERHAPAVLATCRAALKKARKGEGEMLLNEEALAACETISFDHAVLEREANLVAARFEGGWRDVGSWPEFGKLYPERENGNRLEGPVVAKNCRDTLVVGAERPTVVLGLSGMIVVDAHDGLLVSEKSQASGLKDALRSLCRPIDRPATAAQRVMRPWGHYEIMARAADFQIKRLSVNGNAILSLQYHRHRSEHWVVVKGTACITRGDETFELGPEESIHIPREAVHRLENRKQDLLELIEIAFGTYFGEDDIVRLEDRYGRG
jgi:mannose-1-phosphate guanylyltransferase/mannose-6-phosphate isomerase